MTKDQLQRGNVLEQGIRRLEVQIKEVEGIIEGGHHRLFLPEFTLEDMDIMREEHNANMLKLLQDALAVYKKEFDEL